MTDKEIGKEVLDILKRDLTAIVKKNKDGIVILEEKCKIVKSEKH